MFAFLVGWGVFWLLIWLFVLVLGIASVKDDENFTGIGVVGAFISMAYLIACVIGKLVGG
jgi:hypothetical protein